MAAKKYLALLSGKFRQVLGVVTSSGVANDGDFVALDPSGRLDVSVMPVGIGADTSSVTAFENLSAGNFVYIGADGQARKADASVTGKETIGFVLDPATAAQTALVYHEGSNTALTALTPGARYYLSDVTPGGAIATPVVGAGKVSQYLGTAASATRLIFEADDGIILA